MAHITKIFVYSIGFFLSLVVAIQTANATTWVRLMDASSNEFIDCGDLEKMSVIPEGNDRAMKLVMTGNCLGPIGPVDMPTPSGVDDVFYGIVDQGDTVTIDLSDYVDIIVQPPFALSASAPVKGSSTHVIPGALKIMYIAPGIGDPSIPEYGIANDTFSYTIGDASGNPSKTAQVTIPVRWKDPVTPPPPPGGCVDTATVKCMGRLPEWPAGTLRNQRIDAGQTHVWYFDYNEHENADGQFLLFDGNLKVVSLGLNANDFSLEFPCQITQVVTEQPLSYAPAALAGFGHCGLEDGRYYLNIKSTVTGADQYSLAVY